jgi:hypothetical protein
VDVSKPAIVYDTPKEPAVLRKERPVPKAVTSEINTSSTRRRKTPKRRIVDLASTDPSGALAPMPPVPAQPADILSVGAEVEAVAVSLSHYRISSPPEVQQTPTAILLESRKANSQPEVPRIDSHADSELPPAYVTHDGQTVWKEAQDWGASGEMYRRKIEALRNEVGNGYLSALSEESWDPSRPAHYAGSDFSAASTIRNSATTPRTTTAQAIHSGRTIG